MTKRKLISDDQIIVVLYTSPVRNLAESDELPDWISTFANMAKDGYSFSLADSTAAELLTQVRSKRIPRDGYERMVGILRTFLNLDFPILPGKVDLEAMIGARIDPKVLEETAFLAQEAWRQFVDPDSPAPSLGPSLEELLEEERDHWKASLRRQVMLASASGLDLAKSNPDDVAEFLASLSGIDRHREAVDPPMSIRMHLEMRYRYRQVARSALKKEPYDPENKKKRNNGVDVDLYKYLILPALVVATDEGFFGSLETISSFQRDWIVRPETLAARWLAGDKLQPVWPVNSEDDEE